MKTALLTLFLSLFLIGSKAQNCDIATGGVSIVNADNTATALTGCVGQVLNFKFYVANLGTSTSCTIPANTVQAVFSFPTLAGNVKPYIYSGQSSFSTGYFTWTYDASNNVLVGTNTTAIPNGAGDATVLVQVTGDAPGGTAASILNITQNNGVSDNTSNNTGSAQLAIYPIPTVSDQPNQTVCSNSTITVTQNALATGESGAWTVVSGTATITTPNFTGPSTPTTTITGITAGTSATIRYTLTKNGCSTFDDIVLTVTAANTASAASSTPTVCVNTALPAITHTTTGATGIGTPTGLPAGATAAFANNTITIGGTPTEAGTFNYSIPLTGGCGTVSATGTITVTAANTASAASSTPTVCVNTALPAITHTTTGATGIGAPTGLPAGATAAFANNAITIGGTPTEAGTFNYSIPLTGGCGTVSATGTITVNSLPIATIFGTTTICQNSIPAPLVTFTGSNGTAPYTFTYNINGGANQTVVSSGNTATVTVPTTTAGTFTYTLTGVQDASSTTCGSTIGTNNTAVVTVNPITSITTNPVANTTNCQNTTATAITVSATGTGTITYQWYSNISNSNSGGTSIGGATNNSYTPTTTTAGTFYYYAIASGSCGTATSSVAMVTINPAPATPYISSNSPVCAGNTISLTASQSVAVAGQSYVWSGPAGFTSTSQNPTINNATVAQGGTYSVQTKINSTGCLSTVNTTDVIVNALPTVTINGASSGTSSITVGATETLTGAGTPSGGTYVWNSSNTGVATVNNSGLVTGIAIGSSMIAYTYTDPNNCTASATNTVTVSSATAADLTPTITLQTPGFSPTITSQPITVTVFNISSVPSAAGPIVVFILKPSPSASAFTLTSGANGTDNWTIVDNGPYYTITSIGSPVVTANFGSIKITGTLSVSTGISTGKLTVSATIANNTGGETNNSNNSANTLINVTSQ
jgi:hypothetical protein